MGRAARDPREEILTRLQAVRPGHDGRLAPAETGAAPAGPPASQREALLLVGAMGYGYDEAARLIGVPPGMDKSRTNRARARLAGALGLTGGRRAVPRGRHGTARTENGVW